MVEVDQDHRQSVRALARNSFQLEQERPPVGEAGDMVGECVGQRFAFSGLERIEGQVEVIRPPPAEQDDRNVKQECRRQRRLDCFANAQRARQDGSPQHYE